MSESIAPGQKRCTRCQKTKDISEFDEGKSCKDGYRSYCKKCRKSTLYQCKECKQKKTKEELISVGARSTYCPQCWEAIKGKKKCVGCRVYKDIEEFAEDKSRVDGHEYYCKDCRRGHQINKHARVILNRETKRCLECRTTKNLSEFPKDNRARDGVGLFCTMCCNGQKPEAKPEIDTTRENKDYYLSKKMVRQIRCLYGISESEYREMYERQKGLCAICGRPEQKRRKKMLSVDHNHTTGKVRALLCNACNTGLGIFEDNIKYLSQAIEYLKQNE